MIPLNLFSLGTGTSGALGFVDNAYIYVNDGSTDNSKECIEKFLNDDRVKYLEQKNAGVSMARNLAMEQASGEYISFIDPDDILDLTMFEKLMDKIESTKADAVICGYQRFYDDGSKPVESVLFNVEEEKTYNSKEIIDKLLNSEIKGFLWNKIFKAEKIKESNFYFAEVITIFKNEEVINSFAEIAGKKNVKCLGVPYNRVLLRLFTAIYSRIIMKRLLKAIDGDIVYFNNT